jgi:fibronectin-binding autotransporter adhesin
MKPCTSSVAAFFILAFGLSTAVRADLYWDINGATAGGSNSATAAGTWGVDNFWSTSSTGTAATGPWVAGETAVFSAGSGVTGTYDVTLNGTQSASGLTFEEGTVTLTGGTELTLVPSAAINPDYNADGTVDAADYVVWRKTNINGQAGYDAWRAAFGGPGGGGGGTSANINVASGLTATITSPLGGSARLRKTGAGTLRFPDLNQPNTYTGGTTISGGILSFNGEPASTTGTPAPLGPAPATAAADHIIIENGATLSSTDNITTEFDFVLPTRGITFGAGGGTLDVADPAAVLRYTGLINGSEKWTKSGPGRLRLGAAANPFTGGFKVTGGVLVHSAFEGNADTAPTLRASGAAPANVVPDYVVLDGGTIEYNNTGAGSTFLSFRKGITLGANGGGLSLPGVAGDPVANTSISNYFGKISVEAGTTPTLFKRGHGEIRANKSVATDQEGWDHTKLDVEEGLFRIGNLGEEVLFGKVPDSYLADAIRLNGRGTTRVDGAAAIGLTSSVTAHNAVTTTPATRGIFVEANGGTIVTSLGGGSWIFESIISGPGALNINGNGFPITGAGEFATANSNIIFKGANSYAGFTNVNAGILTVDGATAKLGGGNVLVDGTSSLPGTTAVASGQLKILSGVSNAIADTAALTLTGGGTAAVADIGYLELGTGINETVNMLILNGVGQAPGTYGSLASSATFKFDEYFAGTGILTVLAAGAGGGQAAVPEPTSFMVLLLGMVGMALRRRR